MNNGGRPRTVRYAEQQFRLAFQVLPSLDGLSLNNCLLGGKLRKEVEKSVILLALIREVYESIKYTYWVEMVNIFWVVGKLELNMYNLNEQDRRLESK